MFFLLVSERLGKMVLKIFKEVKKFISAESRFLTFKGIEQMADEAL